MPHRRLRDAGGTVFHVLNRAVRRGRLFSSDADYAAFERVLIEALERVPIRLLAYCVMPNHWHLVVWPHSDEIPRFMHWLTLTHAKRWHKAHGSGGTGHVYQNRYRAIPVQSDQHLLTLLRYVERNAKRANLVELAEDWPWCSLWRRCNFCDDLPLAAWPFPQPDNWLTFVNETPSAVELTAVRHAIGKGCPIGESGWAALQAERFGLHTRPAGRPRKINRT